MKKYRKIDYQEYHPVAPHRGSFFLLTLLYAAVIIFISCYHEVWRDEIHALSLVSESDSVFDLFVNLRNDGHPPLWHLILYIGYHLVHHPLVLKIASISIATLAIYVFLSTSPFSWLQKVLFIFGYFPIYEYSVISRNYGISMLLLFCFCRLYSNRFKNIISLSIILFLLTQTNVNSSIIVISVFISLLVEILFHRKKNIATINIQSVHIIGLILITFGIALFILQTYPDNISILAPDFPSTHQILNALLSSILFPGQSFYHALGLENAVFVSVVVWLIYVYLLRKPLVLIIFFSSVVANGMFFKLVYPGGLRHQGFLLLLIIVALWLARLDTYRVQIYPMFLNQVTDFVANYIYYFLTFLLLMQVCMAYTPVKREIKLDFSSSKKLGNLIKENPYLKDAIILGEPDFFMEALPYYVKNQIFIAREGRFGKKVKWTTENKRYYSLDELLNAAKTLRSKLQKPILILIGHQLSREGPYEIKYYYGTYFTYDSKSLDVFFKSTNKIASLRETISDEHYDVFMLK